MRPSALMSVSRAEVTFCGRSEGAPGGMRVRRPGTSAPNCAPVASFRARSRCSTRSSRSVSQSPMSPSIGGSVALRSSRPTSCRRSIAATGVLTAACTVGMSARAKRKSVRRTAIHRTRFRRTYMASDRCRATVLRPEITDHYRSDNASEPRLVGAVRPASLPESAKTSLAQKLTAQARTAWPWDGTGSPTRLIG